MSFADWKKRSELYAAFRERSKGVWNGHEELCQSAYKAGERQGRKDAEAACMAALKLHDLVREKTK